MYNKNRSLLTGTILVVSCILTLASGCKKVSDLFSFNIKNESVFQVSSTVPLNTPFDIITPDVPTQSEQEFANNKTKAALVRDVKLSEMSLTITNPTGKTFSFLKSIHIFISTQDSPEEVEIAFIDNIDPAVSVIYVTPVGVKLDPYIKASAYKLRTKVITRQVITENIEIKAKSTFRVTANL